MKKTITILIYGLVGFISTANYVSAQGLDALVSTSGQLTVQTLAPGEELPLQVQLLNFGTPDERVDVTLFYVVSDAEGGSIIQKTETVAVQTTASFIRNLQIPESVKSGVYYIDLTVQYKEQRFPAISRAQFNVKKSFLGFYVHDWLPSLVFLLIPFILFFVFKKRTTVISVSRDYSAVDISQRMYYEIIHDIIQSLHYHVGDREISKIIKDIPGLVVNQDTSHIESLSGSIPVIIARLLEKYELTVGEKANIILEPNYSDIRVRTH